MGFGKRFRMIVAVCTLGSCLSLFGSCASRVQNGCEVDGSVVLCSGRVDFSDIQDSLDDLLGRN